MRNHKLDRLDLIEGKILNHASLAGDSIVLDFDGYSVLVDPPWRWKKNGLVVLNSENAIKHDEEVISKIAQFRCIKVRNLSLSENNDLRICFEAFCFENFTIDSREGTSSIDIIDEQANIIFNLFSDSFITEPLDKD